MHVAQAQQHLNTSSTQLLSMIQLQHHTSKAQLLCGPCCDRIATSRMQLSSSSIWQVIATVWSLCNTCSPYLDEQLPYPLFRQLY